MPHAGADQVVSMWPLAASMCWSEEGAAARKLLLRNPKLKRALALSLQHLAAGEAEGGPEVRLPLCTSSTKLCTALSTSVARILLQDQADTLEELRGLAQFLRDGVGSASASDPEDLAAVQQLLCRSTVASCLATVDQLFARCKELQGLLDQADDDEQVSGCCVLGVAMGVLSSARSSLIGIPSKQFP
jgi:hypothetical protein